MNDKNRNKYYFVGCFRMILRGNKRYSCRSWIHPLSIPSKAFVTATMFFLECSLLSWTQKGLSLSNTSWRLHMAIISGESSNFHSHSKLQDITDQNTHIYTLIIQNDKAPSQLQIYSFTLANHVQGHINKQE